MSDCRWYVLHAYSGYEKKVADSIMDQANKLGISEHIEEVETFVVEELGLKTSFDIGIAKGVVAECKLKDKKYFIADKILAKHDENYMPPEVTKILKKTKEQ